MLTRPPRPSRTTIAPAKPWQPFARAGRTTLVLLVMGAAVLGLVNLVPAIDLWATSLFHTGADCPRHLCELFPLVISPFWLTLREIGLALPRIVLVGTFVWLCWSLFKPGISTLDDVARPLLGIISAIIGPILLVNWLLKEHWGRPRPFQTDDFGGERIYVPPGVISDQCDSNCSFVSGEAAAAFWLVWLAFVVPPKWRTATLAFTLIFATTVSCLRVAFGRHYVSDVTVSAIIAVACVTGTLWALQTQTARRGLDVAIHWVGRHISR